jgi:hypothetical protein
MNDEEKKTTKGWNAVKQHIKGWDTAQFTALLKDLYDSSIENRAFLDARVQRTSGGSAALETYRQRVIKPFFPKRGFGNLKLGEARKAIRDFRKATGDVAGTAELLMTYVESGAEFTHQYGDIDERFYNSIESALEELADLLKNDGRTVYPLFNERLAEVARLTGGIGWGFHDFVADVVAGLEENFRH